MFKKLLSMALAAIMVMGMGTTAFASEITPKDLDTLDLIIAAGSYLNSDISSEKCITEATFLDKTVPLFNTAGTTVAFYINFAPTGYAVVNNNIENPTVIEFGEGNNSTIEQILVQSSNPHIIYNNPADIYDANTTDKQARSAGNDIFVYFPDLTEKNTSLANNHAALKESILQNQSSLRGDGDYGFVNAADMPSGSYSSDTILSATSTDWSIMGEFNNIANNHCGATAVTNLALYFAQRGSSNLKISTNLDTFKAVHKIVGNGPVMTIAGSAKTYFKDRGYTLNYSSIGDFAGIKTAVANDRPCGILLADGLVSWHWILSVGYREYSNNSGNYMRIMDGWYDNTNRYYKLNTGSTWMSATQYWI